MVEALSTAGSVTECEVTESKNPYTPSAEGEANPDEADHNTKESADSLVVHVIIAFFEVAPEEETEEMLGAVMSADAVVKLDAEDVVLLVEGSIDLTLKLYAVLGANPTKVTECEVTYEVSPCVEEYEVSVEYNTVESESSSVVHVTVTDEVLGVPAATEDIAGPVASDPPPPSPASCVPLAFALMEKER